MGDHPEKYFNVCLSSSLPKQGAAQASVPPSLYGDVAHSVCVLPLFLKIS